MRHLFVSDGKLYSGNEADKLLIEKLEKLEKQVAELTKQLSPEHKESEAIMKNLKNIKGTGL
jgi:seryl-tRNA synthetase